MKGFTVVVAVTLLSPGASRGRAESGTHTLTCGHERTIGQALETLKPGETLLVSGTCNENLVVGEAFHDITLDGQGTAAISGDSSANAVTVTGNGITIRGFTISGGNPKLSRCRMVAPRCSTEIRFSRRRGMGSRSSGAARRISSTTESRTMVWPGSPSSKRRPLASDGQGRLTIE